MCDADDSDNTTPKTMYPYEEVGASVQKRGEKEQTVVHKKRLCSESVYCITITIIQNCLVFEKMLAKKTLST